MLTVLVLVCSTSLTADYLRDFSLFLTPGLLAIGTAPRVTASRA
jgi:hypothetical protein